jgi:hypothetical protein
MIYTTVGIFLKAVQASVGLRFAETHRPLGADLALVSVSPEKDFVGRRFVPDDPGSVPM